MVAAHNNACLFCVRILQATWTVKQLVSVAQTAISRYERDFSLYFGWPGGIVRKVPVKYS